MRTRTFVSVVMAAAALTGVTHADEPAPGVTTAAPRSAMSGRDVHIGVNFRTDFGARYYRADLGMRFGKWDTILVVDPLGLRNSDYDLDAILRYAGETYSVWGGTRLTITPIAREHQYTEKALVGVSAQLPSLGSDRVRIHSGLELTVHVHAHGAGIMTRWVCIDSPDCREDHFVFGLFGRVEYASPI